MELLAQSVIGDRHVVFNVGLCFLSHQARQRLTDWLNEHEIVHTMNWNSITVHRDSDALALYMAFSE